MGSWHSPQSIFNLGHKAIQDLFSVPVQVQEKVDGSFFAFGTYVPEPFGNIDPNSSTIELRVRSKGAMMIADAPMQMFSRAVETVKGLIPELIPGWQYRGEMLNKPKHNALAYDRVPKGNFILFDVLTNEEEYLDYDHLKMEADRLGLEVVPQLFTGVVNNAADLRKYLDTTSVLGGQKIEGIVIKPLSPLYGPDKKLLMGKFVSENYKEVHSKAWGESNPTNGDILLKLKTMYGTQTRWNKSIQHLKEEGVLEGRVQDIGALMRAIPQDVQKECVDEIKEYLWKWAWPNLARLVAQGAPEYYKNLLLEQQFDTKDITKPEETNDGPVYGPDSQASPTNLDAGDSSSLAGSA